MAPWRLGQAGGNSVHLLEAYKPLVEPASAPVLAAAVSSMMASDVLVVPMVVPRERGHHLGAVELTDSCTLEVRVGAGIDMRSRGRAMRGRARYNKAQKSSFPTVLKLLLALSPASESWRGVSIASCTLRPAVGGPERH